MKNLNARSTRPKPRYMAKRPLLTIQIPCPRSALEQLQMREREEVSCFSPMTPTPITLTLLDDDDEPHLIQENETITPISHHHTGEPKEESIHLARAPISPHDHSRYSFIQFNGSTNSGATSVTPRQINRKIVNSSNLYVSSSPRAISSGQQHRVSFCARSATTSSNSIENCYHLRSTTC